MDLGIEGRVAMITGGSRGLGRQAAHSLAREGCKVSICARSQEQLDETVAEFANRGFQVHGTQADVTSEDDAARFYQETIDNLGQPDILVNNVGGRKGTIFEDTSLDLFKEGLELNYWPGASSHERAELGPHREHLVDLWPGARRQRRLHDGQGGADRFVETHGAAIGAHQRAGQLYRPRVHRLPR